MNVGRLVDLSHVIVPGKGSRPMDTVNIYASFKLLWDVNTDVDAMLDEYCRKFFGPAEKPMRSFFSLLESRWTKTPLPGNGVVTESPANVWLYIYPKSVVAQLFAHLEAANRVSGRLQLDTGLA